MAGGNDRNEVLDGWFLFVLKIPFFFFSFFSLLFVHLSHFSYS